MRLLVTLLCLLLGGQAWAVEPRERLADPAQEARAREISQGLRCLVCRNESIDDSNADLAKDIRILLRERIKAGDSDAQARDYIVARYGDYVLLNPPLNSATLVLWLGPVAVLLLAGGSAALFLRRRTAAVPEALSAAEQAAVAKLMREDGPG